MGDTIRVAMHRHDDRSSEGELGDFDTICVPRVGDTIQLWRLPLDGSRGHDERSSRYIVREVEWELSQLKDRWRGENFWDRVCALVYVEEADREREA